MRLSQEEVSLIIKNAEIGTKSSRKSGGQTVGIIDSTIYIKSEEVNFYLEVGFHRSMLRNKEIALDLFELYLSSI